MSDKIRALRQLMQSHQIQAYFIPSTDPHQSEYVPEFWQRRQFVSGFTGSAGEVVVTQDKAGLWTDSRYYLQAEQQLDPGVFVLFKVGQPNVPSWQSWVGTELRPGDCLGLDPTLISHKEFTQLKKELALKQISIKSIPTNLVDLIWDSRPPVPAGPIFPLSETFAGESVQRKLTRLREKMAEQGTQALVVTLLDAIAWLLNIRGMDVNFNPVVISYVVVTREQAFLFVDLAKVPVELPAQFQNLVEIRSYESFPGEIQRLAESHCRIWLDPATVNQGIVELLAKADLLFKPSPITLFKAVKNPVEIAGIQNAHIRDGVAMVQFLHWLEKTMPVQTITEWTAAEKVNKIRSQAKNFMGPSFETISSYAGHGAIIHYAVTPETDVPLRPEGLYLIDSGGQYLDGTTDITRTIALGPVTAVQKDRFTRVLQGMIRLSMTAFPQGTSGKQLDTIAREPLWEVGLNFGHGTGHGVGAFLNVHEGPHAISFYRCIGIGLEPGMITTNEPGFYQAGEFGVRTENILLVVPAPELSQNGFTFYRFETLTLCPIDTRLMNCDQMDARELAWLNAYHRRVRETLTPFLDADQADWLAKATQPVA